CEIELARMCGHATIDGVPGALQHVDDLGAQPIVGDVDEDVHAFSVLPWVGVALALNAVMKATLSSLILAASLAGGTGVVLPAAYAHGDAYVVAEEPPAPREEVVVDRPGYVYIRGHWGRDHGRWAWSSGRYERERHG